MSGMPQRYRPPGPSPPSQLLPSFYIRTVSHVLELDVLGVLNGGVADGGGAVEVVMGRHGWVRAAGCGAVVWGSVRREEGEEERESREARRRRGEV